MDRVLLCSSYNLGWSVTDYLRKLDKSSSYKKYRKLVRISSRISSLAKWGLDIGDDCIAHRLGPIWELYIKKDCILFAIVNDDILLLSYEPNFSKKQKKKAIKKAKHFLKTFLQNIQYIQEDIDIGNMSNITEWSEFKELVLEDLLMY